MIKKTFAIVGTPNCGKSSLFNSLTGSNQRVGNYPGITVEKKTGTYSDADYSIEFLDLPGLYSLDTRTLDERVSKNIILNKDKQNALLDGLVVVVDSTNLERSLYLVMELKLLEVPMVVALNLWDLAQKRNMKLNLELFEKELGIKVVTTSARSGFGSNELINEIKNISDREYLPKEVGVQAFRTIENIKNNFSEISRILKLSLERNIDPDNLTEKIDRYILHPVWGPLILLVVLAIMFQAIFTWSGPFSDLIEQAIGWLSEFAKENISIPLLSSLVADGIIAGVGSVFVFLPQIIFLFFFILILEDIGYLGRAALMMDGVMRRLGLPGKSVVPLLSSHACSIPGIMAARTIDNDKDRLVTMLVAPVTTCSARIPVYTLLIAAIVPEIKVLGFLDLRGLAMLGMYLIGIISSLILAFVFKKTVITGSASHLLLEMPGYRFPTFKSVLLNIFQRAKVFTKKAGTIILALSVVIWFLVTFPKQDGIETTIENSYAARIGKTFTPIFEPIGFDWRLTTALIPSMGAREVVVSTLATVLSVQGEEGTEDFDQQFTKQVVANFGVPSLLALLAWFVFAPQCIAMIAIFKRESDSIKWTTIMVTYTFTLAYIFSFLTYHVSRMFF